MRRALLAGACVLFGLAAIVLLSRGGALPDQGALAIGGPFSLMDGQSHAVTDQDFRGRWMLIYFGYTHCPDVCPATLGGIAEGVSKLPAAERQHVVPIFITVDPQRDTAAVVGDYARAFGPDFVGLTGSEAAIGAVEKEYRVFAQRHALKAGDYAMDHSSVIYVMAPDGRFAAVLDDTMAPAAMAERLVKLGV